MQGVILETDGKRARILPEDYSACVDASYIGVNRPEYGDLVDLFRTANGHHFRCLVRSGKRDAADAVDPKNFDWGCRMAWISVADRMPEHGTKCLIYIPAKDMAREVNMVASWSQFEGWWPCGCRRSDVTHWMPLPGPPV